MFAVGRRRLIEMLFCSTNLEFLHFSCVIFSDAASANQARSAKDKAEPRGSWRRPALSLLYDTILLDFVL